MEKPGPENATAQAEQPKVNRRVAGAQRPEDEQVGEPAHDASPAWPGHTGRQGQQCNPNRANP